VKGKDRTKVAFESLDESISDECRVKWLEDEEQAMEHRGVFLKIYEVQMEKGV
jgi:hypothetical protein